MKKSTLLAFATLLISQFAGATSVVAPLETCEDAKSSVSVHVFSGSVILFIDGEIKSLSKTKEASSLFCDTEVAEGEARYCFKHNKVFKSKVYVEVEGIKESVAKLKCESTF